MNADDARIKDTISKLRKVEKHLYGTNTRVALLLKHGLDELEALLAAPPLGEAPTLTVEQEILEEYYSLLSFGDLKIDMRQCEPNFFDRWETVALKLKAWKENVSQPPRVLQRTTIAHLTEQLICTHDETQYRALLDENLKLRDRERKVIENAMRWGTNVNPVWFDHPHYGAERLSTEIDNFLNALAALPREREEKS